MYHLSKTNTISIHLIILITMMITSCASAITLPETPTETQTDPASQETAMRPADQEPYSGAVFYFEEAAKSAQGTPKPEICYRVTAIKALNLRAEPETKSRVLYWLSADETVTYISTVQDVWYQVKVGAYVGYAHSAYLERTKCK